MADIDFGKIQVYVGNYDFWYEASQLHFRQKETESKKAKAKAEELKDFIRRFSSNASKAKQATSRKKLLEKLTIEADAGVVAQIPLHLLQAGTALRRHHPRDRRTCPKTIDGVTMFRDLSLTVNKGDKIAFVGAEQPGQNHPLPDSRRGAGAGPGQLPVGRDHQKFLFSQRRTAAISTMVNSTWSAGCASSPRPGRTRRFIRGFLGKMLFSGEEATKKTSVLSGGERVRCMLARMMLADANALILDEPTNHLDLESITALNNGLIAFPEVVLFASHDHQFVSTVANRIVEITPDGIVDVMMSFDDYLAAKETALTTEPQYLARKAA